MDKRSVLAFAVIGAFSFSLAATSKAPPPSGTPAADAPAASASGPPRDAAFAAVMAAANAPVPADPCTDATLDAIVDKVPVAATWQKPDKHTLLLFDQPVAATFSRANAQKDNPDDGWWWLGSMEVKDLHPKKWSADDQSDSKISSNIGSVAGRPFFAVVHADARALPKTVPGSDRYEGGSISGKLVVARIDGGAPVCAIDFVAKSSSEVKFKTSGITGKSFDEAILQDFQKQAVADIEAAVKRATPSYSIVNVHP